MQTVQTNPGAKPSASPRNSRLRTISGRRVAVSTAVLFIISSMFPIVAGLSRNTASFPKWWGPLDVALAFVLAIMAFVILVLAQGRVNRQAAESSYRAYRFLTHGIFAMNVVFLLFGDRIVWTQCLPGFAWRTWLLLYCLPAWFATMRATPGLSGPDGD